jgi:hypothetical protein
MAKAPGETAALPPNCIRWGSIEWLWDLAPDDLKRLNKCVKAYERRYPRSDHAITFRRKISSLKRKKQFKTFAKLTLVAALLTASLFAYDFVGYRSARLFAAADNPPAAVEKAWTNFFAWHPTHPFLFPKADETARRSLTDSHLNAEAQRIASGADRPGLAAEIQAKKIAQPELAPELAKVELALGKQKHEKAWKALQIADPVAIDKPDEYLASLRAFLREFPETSHRAEAVALIGVIQKRVETRRDHDDRQAVDSLVRKAGQSGASLRDLIDGAETFLNDRPDSRYRSEVQELAAEFVRRLDEADIQKPRQLSKDQPTNFAARRQRYQEYLRNHVSGGRFVGEAQAAIEAIDRERDDYLYRLAYDHFTAHPDDVQTVAQKLKTYLDANPEGRHAKDAKAFVSWWEKTSSTSEYKVVLRRGEVESDVGKYFSGGAPDLSVEVYVRGDKYGPSPVVVDSHKPIWDYAFPKPIKWKYGDPISIQIKDNDWSESSVFTFNTPQGDKLAMKMLSGTVRPSKGGKTMLVFTSDFALPELSKP